MTITRDAAAPACLNAGRMGFNGELFESAAGHYLLGNGYRAYSPLLMIFLQPDNWSPFEAGGLNAYAYCAGDPVNAADPTGHMPFTRLLQPGRMSRSPSPPRHNIPSDLPVLSADDVVQTLAGLASRPVPGSSVGRVSPDPVWPSESFSPPPILVDIAPAVSQSSSALLTPARSAGPSRGVVAPNRHKIDYQRLETEIARMAPSYDAEGILRLSRERFTRIPVLRELRWQWLRRPGESRPEYPTRVRGPRLLRGDLVRLEDRARVAGTVEQAEFYATLRDGFFPVQWR